MDFSIVCVYNNGEILNLYLLKSLERQTIPYELILLDGSCDQYKCAADGLNVGGEKARGRYLMFVHQDVKIESDQFLEESLNYLDKHENLGIAGIAGKIPESRKIMSNSSNGTPPWKLSKHYFESPVMAQTLDECVLIIPRVRFEKTRFDPVTCNNWHLYGVDYSLMMKSKGFDVIVLPTQVYHLSDGTSLNSAYFSTLKRLIKKHRDGTKIIATTVCNWSTTIPVEFQECIFLTYYYSVSLYRKTMKFFKN
jgi:GT2 family glycosyltransferase